MQMSGSGGYLLVGYKVRSNWGQGCLTNLNLSSANEGEENKDEDERPGKKQKIEE